MARSSTTSRTGRIAFGVGMVVILALLALLPARADVRIVSSPGGAVDAYLAAFARVRQSGERVIIDGPICLHTGAEHDPPQSYLCHPACGARLPCPRWFYPRTGYTARAPEATRTVTASYPPGVRAWIKKRGGLTQKPIYLRGKELAALYPRC